MNRAFLEETSKRTGSDSNRVLFIVPPNISYEDFVNPPANVKGTSTDGRRYGAAITDMPLGVMSLSAYLKKHQAGLETSVADFNVALNKIKDFRFDSFSEFFQQALSQTHRGYDPDIVGISALFTPSFQSLLDLGELSRKMFPRALIVAGGGVPTNMASEIFRDSSCFDGLCYGEGERPMLGLVQAQDKRKYLETNNSWITRDKLGRGFKLDLISDLDEIPSFDYEFLDREGYQLNPTIMSYTSIADREHSVPVMTTRGCNFHCCFCASHTVHGREVRYQSLGRVNEELTRHKKEGRKTIIFQDDHFMADKARAHEVLNIMHELGLNAFFPNSLALYALDRPMLESLQRIGVSQLVLSVESGSNRVLHEIMHKPLNLDIVRRVASDCRDLGIYTDVNLLVGLPGETRRDIEDARQFLRTVNANWFRINVATPLVGSEMFQICKERGYFVGNPLSCNYKRAVVGTEDFTPEEVQDWAYLLNLDLNFVSNSDMRLGNYKTALMGLENAIRAKADHGFAHYYASICYNHLGQNEKAEEHRKNAREIFKNDPSWKIYAEKLEARLDI